MIYRDSSRFVAIHNVRLKFFFIICFFSILIFFIGLKDLSDEEAAAKTNISLGDAFVARAIEDNKQNKSDEDRAWYYRTITSKIHCTYTDSDIYVPAGGSSAKKIVGICELYSGNIFLFLHLISFINFYLRGVQYFFAKEFCFLPCSWLLGANEFVRRQGN